MVFAALSYPLLPWSRSPRFDYLAYVAVGVAGERPDPEYVGFFALCLACTAVLCGWHARNQDRRREALARVSRADPLTGASTAAASRSASTPSSAAPCAAAAPWA